MSLPLAKDKPHRYESCRDSDCERSYCRIWREAYQTGWDECYPQAWMEGYGAGYSAGLAAGSGE